MKRTKDFQKQFEIDVKEGLSSFPKYLSSKYIYDKRGDKLFQDIMNLPEYYLTNAEFEILDTYKSDLRKLFAQNSQGFDLIELGAGDGKKTKLLLEEFYNHFVDFTYIPVDISQSAIDSLTADVKSRWNGIHIQGEQGTYFQVLEKLKQYNKRPKIVMVLGSNIGNLKHEEAIDFLQNISDSITDKDYILMGFDQKKHPEQIHEAYSDKTGVTQEFNRNLLHRINSELDANFPVNQFIHWEAYNPETGTAKSFLVALKACTITIKKLDISVHFDQWETIHTEISQKYDDSIVEWLASESDLIIAERYADSSSLYKNYLFKKNTDESSLEP